MSASEAFTNFLKSNEAINKLSNIEAAKGMFDGIGNVLTKTVKSDGTKEGIMDAVIRAHHKGNSMKNGISAARVAGSVFGVSTAYRIASGGGLYKDKNGNTNVVGIPFI